MIDVQSGYKINATKFILQDDFQTADTENRVRKMQILRVGTFHDSRYGKFSITKKMLGEMVSNFHAGVRGVIPALDYKHESEGISAGWFKDLYIDGDELWAEVEMTPRGAKILADKEFGYVSADFDTQYIDNEHQKNYGCVLLGAGLTNRPVVKRMESVIQLEEKTDPVSEKISKLVKEGYPQDQAVAIALDMERKNKLAEGEEMKPEIKPEMKPEMKPEVQPEVQLSDAEMKLADMEKKCAEMEAQCAEMKKLADASNNMAIDQIIELIKKAMEAEKPADEPKPEIEPEIEIEAMEQTKKELAEVKAKLQLSERINKFQVMLSEGKAVEAQREAFLKNDMEAFVESAIAIKLSEVGHAGTPTKINGTAEEEVLKQAKTLSESKKIGMKEAISEVLNSNKQLAEKIR